MGYSFLCSFLLRVKCSVPIILISMVCESEFLIKRFQCSHGSGASLLAEHIPTRHGRMEKPESGIRNRSRKRKRNLNRNRNLNLRNKTWRRFCLKSVTNNYCSIKTFHPHIIFIYCYYIFYCRIFCVRRKIILREFHIRVSVATWDHH